jgi:nucleoside-diphosphate-sugar epimerase
MHPDRRPVVVTGANGFAGRAIARTLIRTGIPVRLVLRRPEALPDDLKTVTAVKITDLDGQTDWAAALDGASAVVHAAGMAHQPRDVSEAALFKVNADAVGHLAREAEAHGLERAVLISSVRAVCGNWSDTVIEETTLAAPTDAYGRSKLAGDEAFLASGLAGFVLRPPLIVGAQAQANFGKLLRLARSRAPLPFGSVKAPRSIVGVDTIADACQFLLSAPLTERVLTTLIAEASTEGLAGMIRLLRRAQERSAGLIAVPAGLLVPMIAAALGRSAADSLFRPLALRPTRLAAMGWCPPQTLEAVLAAAMLGTA